MTITQRVRITSSVLWNATKTNIVRTAETNIVGTADKRSTPIWDYWCNIWDEWNIRRIVDVLEGDVLALKLELDPNDTVFNLSTTTMCGHITGTLDEFETITLVHVAVLEEAFDLHCGVRVHDE